MIATEQQNYYFGNGKVAAYARDTNGSTTKGVFFGNCPDMKITLNTEAKPHYESMSGRNLQDRDVITQIGAEISLTLENLNEENLALLVWGVKQAIAAQLNQTYTFPTVEVGGVYRIPNGFNLADLVIEDSTGSPLTLVEGDNYSVDPAFGTVKILSLTTPTIVQPLEASFDAGAATIVPFFTSARPNRFLQFNGLNKGNEVNTNVQVEVYNVVFDPVSDLSLITDDFGKYELKGKCLVDLTREADAELGGFGRKIYLGA